MFLPGIGSTPFVVDVGANRGDFSYQMNDRFGGVYHLVEANPALASNLRSTSPFTAHNFAVAARDGSAKFNIAQNDEGSSVLDLPSESVFNCTRVETVTVPTLRLESLLAEIGQKRIDVVKMDIEGAEVQVLHDMSSAALRQIGQITVEFHCAPVFGFGMRDEVEAIMSRMKREGFVGADFSGGDRTDCLFVNTSYQRIRPAVRAHILAHSMLRPPLTRLWRTLPVGVRGRIRGVHSS